MNEYEKALEQLVIQHIGRITKSDTENIIRLRELIDRATPRKVFKMGIDSEKNYLSSIIKPFRDRVIYIGKFTEGEDTDKSFIEIGIDGDLEIVLPVFPNNQMYLEMKEDRKYALKELGL